MAVKSELAKIVASYKEVFKSGPGQVVLDDMVKSWANRVSHTKGDPYETAFKEGQRSVVVRIRYMLDTKLEDMENEHGD